MLGGSFTVTENLVPACGGAVMMTGLCVLGALIIVAGTWVAYKIAGANEDDFDSEDREDF